MREATFWGGARFLSISSGTTNINPRLARFWRVTASVGGLGLQLPDARNLSPGGPVIVVMNELGSNKFNIKDNAGTNIVTAATAGNVFSLWLVSNVTAAGTWKYIERVAGAGTLSTSMRVGFVVGGNPSTATYAWNESTATWTTATAVPNSKIEGATMPVGPNVYFVGDDPSSATSKKTDQLAPSGAWTARTDCPQGPARTCGAGVGGYGYVYGGTAISDVFRYALDTWATIGKVPLVMTRGTARGSGIFAYLMAGEPWPRTHIVHKPSQDVYWSLTSFASPSRYGLASWSLDHLIYVACGKADTPTWHAEVDEYNPVTDVWTSKTALTSGARHRGCGFGGNRNGYYMGGRNSGDTQQQTAASFINNTWTVLGTMPGVKSECQNTGAAL